VARIKAVKEGFDIVLRRRAKRRYLSITHGGSAVDVVNSIVKRHAELFGSVATERAGIRLMRSNDSLAIIKCRLEQLDSVLATIALTDPPAMTWSISGSIKRLTKPQNDISRILNP
jgi:RNase P/RNase MRP subunit POP5